MTLPPGVAPSRGAAQRSAERSGAGGGRHAARRSAESRWTGATQWPLVGAALVFLLVYSVQVIAEPDGVAAVILVLVLAVTWLLFVADYLVRLTLARGRWRWFTRHLFDFVTTVLPVFRPLRMLQLLKLFTLLQRATGAALRGRVLAYGLGASVIVVYVGALAVLQAERTATESTITSFGDAIWWACVTITTVGYGDVVPVTVPGRVVGVLVMASGIAVLGVASATMASWLVERVSAGPDGGARHHAVTHTDPHAELLDEVRALRGETTALRREISALRTPLAVAPAGPRNEPTTPQP